MLKKLEHYQVFHPRRFGSLWMRYRLDRYYIITLSAGAARRDRLRPLPGCTCAFYSLRKGIQQS